MSRDTPRTLHPYYPAQLVPLGVQLKSEGPRVRVASVMQDGAVVTLKLTGVHECEPFVEMRTYAFDQCVYVDHIVGIA